MAPIYCNHCGAPNATGAAFCSRCGQSVQVLGVTAQPGQVAPPDVMNAAQWHPRPGVAAPRVATASVSFAHVALLAGVVLALVLAVGVFVLFLSGLKPRLSNGLVCTIDSDCASDCCALPSEEDRSLGRGQDGARRCAHRTYGQCR